MNVENDRGLSPTKVAEGKTKIIWTTSDHELVRIESKDDITAGDGAKRDVIAGKAAIATETTANVFQLLKANGISTHFLIQDSDTSFLARRADMIPIECVARRVATGSFLKRNPDIQEGYVFDEPPIEFYYKDDAAHDPKIEYDTGSGEARLYDAKRPVDSSQPIRITNLEDLGVTPDELERMMYLTSDVFKILERAWSQQNIMLVDMKIEFGRDSGGALMVADVIDNDSWRIWPGGNKSMMLDKQRYRNIEKPTPEELSLIKDDYQKVAEMTRAFLSD